MKILDSKKLVWIFLLLFVVSLLPILYLSGYVHASGDDYGYGTLTHIAWLQTHSIPQTLRAAAVTVGHYYRGWQGTWFTVFLMALQPEVFSPDAYWIVPWIMLGINIGATSVLLHYVLVKMLGLPKPVWGCVNILLLLSMLQFVPSTKSAIFWWNGAVHYIVPYSLAMLAVYAMLRFSDTKKKRFLVFCGICMFCLGGSSYLAPLFALIVLFYMLVFAGRKKRHLFWLLVPAAVEIAGLAASFWAPGNKCRGGAEFGFHWSLAALTVLKCFREGALSVVTYLHTCPVVFLLFLVAGILVAEGFLRGKTTFCFPLPILFFALMFCLYCAMYAPGLYAGVEVSGGVPNTIFWVFLLTFLADLVYGLGWLCTRWGREPGGRRIRRMKRCYLPLLFAGGLLVFLQKGTLKQSTFYICCDYVLSGQADDYKAQMEERLGLLLDPELEEVELPAMNPEQGPLMHMEVMEDPDVWTNTVVKEFYRKKRVVQIP